jgi:hypothetical protein
VLVGKRPGSADAAFTLTAKLFLPPANDSSREARSIRRLPQTVTGTTIGATGDEADTRECGLAGGTVWYSLKPKVARIVLKLQTRGNLDATLVALRRFRSDTDLIGCGRTNRARRLVVAWDVEPGATYLLAVGQRQGSPPGEFTLQAVAAQARERSPGRQLASGGVATTVDWLSDVNDVYWARFEPGTTYRVAFSSNGCATLSLRGPNGPLRSWSCGGYATFTPGPDGGGRYLFEVTAPSRSGAVGYRLSATRAGPDDVGIGQELANLANARGSLAPLSGDVVDIRHFDVTQPSDVRLRLSTGAGFSLLLLTDTGRRLAAGEGEVSRTLSRGRYVVAVQARAGTSGGTYTLGLVVRQLTRTTLSASAHEIRPGASVTFTVEVKPQPNGGSVRLQIDRFDPLDGWQFNRFVRLQAAGGRITWTPPAAGRWRARATYGGTLLFSQSRTGYLHLLVASPLRVPLAASGG